MQKSEIDEHKEEYNAGDVRGDSGFENVCPLNRASTHCDEDDDC